jgi:hypothetical protein
LPGLPYDVAPRPDYSGKVTVRFWIWDDYEITVAFDEDDEVVGYYLLEVLDRPSQSSGFFDRLRKSLGF